MLFNSLRQIKESIYYTDANYYAGFLALKSKDYSTALTSFEIAAENPDYKTVVPFYIAQLFYFTGEVNKSI